MEYNQHDWSAMLELERIAVGPYCVFDNWHPKPPSILIAGETPSTAPNARPGMEDSYDDYAFGQRLQGPWMVPGSDDYNLGVPPPDAFPSGRNWEDWMTWDPNAAPLVQKSLHTSQPIMTNMPGADKPAMENDSTLSAAAAPGFTFTGPFDTRPVSSFGQNGAGTQAPGNGIAPISMALPAEPTSDEERMMLFSPLGFDRQQSFESTQYPPPQSTPSLHHSPASTTDVKTTPSSRDSPPDAQTPPSDTNNKKKRKSSLVDVEDKADKAPPPKKTAHNMIEKRYRTNLNEKIAALRNAVPSLRAMSKQGANGDDDDLEDLEGLTPAHKLNKATVLSKATEYIHHLEKRCKKLQEENDSFKQRFDSMDKMSMAGPMGMAMMSNVGSQAVRVQEDPFAAAAQAGPMVPGGPQGMIAVPQSMVNLHRQAYYSRPEFPAYPQYRTGPVQLGMMAQQSPQAMANGQMHPHGMPGQAQHVIPGRAGGNGFMNKLMVGSLAGLMVLEGFHEHEQSADTPAGRGLFAAPFHLLSRLGPKMPSRLAMQNASTLQRAIPLLKSFAILAAVVYLLMPLLTFKPQRKKRPLALVRLAPAPSLASPVEVRRTAWLTAIQTVWVPQHNFFLEVAALGLKFSKISIRKFVGWEGYAYLTGITKEQEAARVKAWEIALDAQLTGGDAEISMSRLVLTLMASSTLPDSPCRLMLKAFHWRLLLWEVAKAGYGDWYMFDDICLKIARRFWNAAREEQRLAANSTDEKSKNKALPPHLAALLELECDEVLIKEIMQREYNLAWNRPSADNTSADATMDSVVEDFAISSPLDALAAWWSTHALGNALADYLDDATTSAEDERLQDTAEFSWKDELALAISTAPPLSRAWTRALVAKAVLIDTDREKHILEAFEALPARPKLSSTPSSPSSSSTKTILMNAITETPASPDVQTALTLAKCLALTDPDSAVPEARASAAQVINHYTIPNHAFSSLSFVAAYKLIDTFACDEELFSMSKSGLESMTMAMRMWMGREGGQSCGVAMETRGVVVERCLGISRMLVGMNVKDEREEEIDLGYHTQSDKDEACVTVG